MEQDDKKLLMVKINIIQGKVEQLEKRILTLETSRPGFILKKLWNRFFSVLYAMLTTAETGETFLDRVRMFGSTMWSWAKSGFKITDELNAIARLEVCRSCPQLTENEQCRMCGCLMNKKVKIASASCPLKKW